MIDKRQGPIPGVRLLEQTVRDIALFACLRVPGHGIYTKKA